LIALFGVGCFKTVAPTLSVDPITEPGSFPYDLYDQVFSSRVTDDGLIDYAAIRDDREPLDRFLGHVAAVSPASDPALFPSDDHALAFYLNAYNALAVQGILDRPDIVTVDDNKVEFFYTTRYRIGGDKVSLYTLENGIIRDQFDEPRIHFFLNCQSWSCPPFPPKAIRPDAVDTTLNAFTEQFMADPKHVELKGDTLEVSSIFKWYAGDFGGQEGIVPFIQQYRDDIPDGVQLVFKDYDWTLIEQPGKGPDA
jgi:hypothetical protein